MVLDEDIEVELVKVGPERRMTNELIAAERKLQKKKRKWIQQQGCMKIFKESKRTSLFMRLLRSLPEMSQRISSNKYHKVFWLPRRGYRSLGKQPTYTNTNTLLVYFNMTGKRCGSHKKKEKKKDRKGRRETSKRITRRNNKLTNCEKGEREG